MFKNLEEVKEARRSGKKLYIFLEDVLHSEKLLHEYSSPIEIIKQAGISLYPKEEGAFLDMTTTTWLNLKVEQQIHYASEYQHWYAGQIHEPIEKLFEGKGTAIEMMLIPPGKFWMGSPENEKEIMNNENRHKVLISQPFWCGKYPVTQEQWQAVMGKIPSGFWQRHLKSPAEGVRWNDCQKFCTKTEFRFLTEAQWEYTCRAGTTTRYFFGEDETQLTHYAWYVTNSSNISQEVGQKRANAFGVHDILGNVYEWCQDLYKKNLGIQETLDPVNLLVSSSRVNRGGGWGSSADLCRCAYRSRNGPSNRAFSLGFRVCRSL